MRTAWVARTPLVRKCSHCSLPFVATTLTNASIPPCRMASDAKRLRPDQQGSQYPSLLHRLGRWKFDGQSSLADLRFLARSDVPTRPFRQYMTKVKEHKGIDAALRAAIVTSTFSHSYFGCKGCRLIASFDHHLPVGSHGGNARKPMTAAFAQKCMIKNTVSLAWRIGRACLLANKTNQISNIGPILVDALGGSDTAKVLFKGKITGLSRTLFKGHTIGEVTIGASEMADVDDEDKTERFAGSVKSESFSRQISVPINGR